jgi:hypothetical protein
MQGVTWIGAVAAFLLTTAPCFAEQPVDRYGPAEKLEALRAKPEQIFSFIVRGAPPGLAAARALAVSAPDFQKPVELGVIAAIALSLKEADADALSRRDDIVQVWYVHQDLFDEYVNVIEAIDNIVRTQDGVVPINMSLGPPASLMPMLGHIEEPMNEATRQAALKGNIPIFAIGNYFTPDRPDPGVVNPWCLPEWVICVGAADAAATRLFDHSARGAPDLPETWPTVVADGIDVIGPWPVNKPKTPKQKQYDQSNAEFIARVPADKRGIYTIMSGTSQAAAQVTRAVAQIVYFVSQVAAQKNTNPGDLFFSLTIPEDRFAAGARRGPRLTGDVGEKTSDGVEVRYRLVEPWKLVKQLLIDSAIPMPTFAPSEVGAGFVSPDYIEQQFGQFGLADKEILPMKVVP